MIFRRVGNSTKKFMFLWYESRIPSFSAALAFYMIFSLIPMLHICISIASIFFTQEVARNEISHYITHAVGENAALQVQMMMDSKDWSLTKNVISAIIFTIGASGIFGEMQSGLNSIWDVKPNKKRRFIQTLSVRFIPYIMIIGISLLFLISLIVSTFLITINAHYNNVFSAFLIGPYVGQVISFLFVIVLISLMFKVLPDIKTRWQDVWLGAVVTALLFNAGQYLFTLYLSKTNILSAFGAASSFIVLLIWVYFSAQIFFTGALITKIYAANRKPKAPR